MQASKSLLPVESQKTYFIPSAMNCDHICEMLTISRRLIRDLVPQIFIGFSLLHRHLYLAYTKNLDSQ